MGWGRDGDGHGRDPNMVRLSPDAPSVVTSTEDRMGTIPPPSGPCHGAARSPCDPFSLH